MTSEIEKVIIFLVQFGIVMFGTAAVIVTLMIIVHKIMKWMEK